MSSTGSDSRISKVTQALAARGVSPGALAFLMLCVVIHVIMQLGPIFKWTNGVPSLNRWNLWEWFIEDAAISFAYARNLYEGDGLVAFRGGERVEGYSNPTWVALLALWHFVGIDGFQSAKVMSLGFGCLTVVLTWFIAREALDDDASPAPLIAPLVLAITPQFAFWNASGLENPLFSFLLAGGIWRTLVEARTGAYPWSSVWFLLLACTRPEAIMYSAWGGFMALTFQVTQGRGLRSTWQWLGTFFVPFTIYHVIRYEYFAWAFPNTYYAKLGDKEFRPFALSSRGWKYIRNFSSSTFDSSGREGTGTGWFVPVYFAGILGLRGTRGVAVLLLSLVTAACFLYPSSDLTNTWTWWPKAMYEPAWWKEFRVWTVFGIALGLPVAAMADRGSRGRVMCWGMLIITLFFCIASSGDWMKGFRWMSFLSVPAAVLFAAGVQAFANLASQLLTAGEGRAWLGWTMPSWVAAPAIVLALTPGYYYHSEWFFGKRETGPYSVEKRVRYTAGLTEGLFLRDQLIRNLDVDMGAHTFWSPHQMVDMAGLVDVTIAHHVFSQRPVTKEYIFEEMKPQIAHVHGGWATNSRIPTFPEWEANYFEVPPFPVSTSTNHMGTFIRRDLVMHTEWEGKPERRMVFEDGVTLAGWRIPSPEVSAGKSFYLEIGVQYDKAENRQDIRMLGFLSDARGRLQVFDLPPAYDWLPPAEWRQNEIFYGKFAPSLEKELEPGSYEVGFVFLAVDGHVLSPKPGASLPPGVVVGTQGDARFAVGEIRFADALTIGEAGTGEKGAREDFERAIELARNVECAASERAWRLAWLHLPRATKWYDDNRGEIAPLLATCWAEHAKQAASLEESATSLAHGRVWDHQSDILWEVADDIGEQLMQRGYDAVNDEDWEAAYDAFDAAVRAKPTLSWARRYAEDARDHRFKLDEETVAAAKAERDARAEKSKEAQAAKAKAKAEGEADAPAAEAEGTVKKEKAPKPKATPRPAPEAEAEPAPE